MKAIHAITIILLCVLVVMQGVTIKQIRASAHSLAGEHDYIMRTVDIISSKEYGLEDQIDELRSLICEWKFSENTE